MSNNKTKNNWTRYGFLINKNFSNNHNYSYTPFNNSYYSH